jgi:rhomboid protease GluP
MSLDYQNEEPPVEHSENTQRVAAVVPYYSIILIVCLVLVFISQLVADGSNSFLEGGRISVLLAGFVKQLFNAGQYWRILTGASLHGGLAHLLLNCYALYVLGRLIETLSNRAHLAIVFLISAVFGGVLSLIFIPDIPSVGASGGIVGFLGYLTVYGFKRRKLLPESFLQNMLFNVGLIAFFGIFIMPNIDNFGHLGGLLAGAAYGWAQIPGDLYKDPREAGQTTKIAGAIALGVFILTSIFSILLLLGVIPVNFPELP